MSSNTNTRINQTCQSCEAASNCARCSLTNSSQCTICSFGSYLNSSNICASCPSNCMGCISPDMCLVCAVGYIPAQSGMIEGMNAAFYPQTCVACASPCAACFGDIYSCLACINSNYTLQGDVCISNFNYLVSIVFNVDLNIFQNNYLNFMNQIASAAGVSINDISVISIVSGSVTINMAITSPNPPGSQGAINAQNNLNNLIQQGSTVNNMLITSSSVTPQGGSNNPDNSGGLSTTDIILMAVLIPVGVLRTYKFI